MKSKSDLRFTTSRCTNWANPPTGTNHLGSDDAFMNEGWLSYCRTAALVVCFLCLGLLWGCSQRTAPQRPLGLPERSLATEPEIKVRLFDLAQFSCEVGAPSDHHPLWREALRGRTHSFLAPTEGGITWVLQRGTKVLAKQRSTVLNLTSSEPMTIRKEVFPTTTISMRIEGTDWKS